MQVLLEVGAADSMNGRIDPRRQMVEVFERKKAPRTHQKEKKLGCGMRQRR